MALAIDATVGGASANSFVTLAEAEAYMLSRLNGSLWTAATDDTKNRACVESTRVFSGKMWIGSRVTSTQALAWPRAWAEVADPVWPAGTIYYDTTVIPQRIKDATMELAFQFVKAGTTDLAVIDPEDNKQKKAVDVLTTEYVAPWARKTGLAKFLRIMDLIRPLLASTGASNQLVRG